MIYCDTSLLVSALLSTEPASRASQVWLTEQPAGGLAASGWVGAEFASAIAMRCRRGDLDSSAQARVLGAWRKIRSHLTWFSVDARDFDSAAELVLRPNARLRSGDALHLAVALGRGCELATLDKDLFDAADALGIAAGPMAAHA